MIVVGVFVDISLVVEVGKLSVSTSDSAHDKTFGRSSSEEVG